MAGSSWSDEDKHLATAGLLFCGSLMVGLAIGNGWEALGAPVGFVLFTAYMVANRVK